MMIYSMLIGARILVMLAGCTPPISWQVRSAKRVDGPQARGREREKRVTAYWRTGEM